MATLTITKVSGVYILTPEGDGQPKSYFGATGKYQVLGNNTTLLITIGGDVYQVEYTDLRIGGQTPASVSTARTLLNSIFGS